MAEDRFAYVWKQINEIEKTIINILVPMKEYEIVGFLKNQDEVRTRDLNWIGETRLERYASYKAFEKLQKENRIISVSHGRGRDRTWHLKEA